MHQNQLGARRPPSRDSRTPTPAFFCVSSARWTWRMRRKKPDDDDWNVNQKPKCEDEVFAIDDCTPHQYEEMREHVGSIFAKMWERELTMTEVRGYLKLYQLKAKDTIKEAHIQRKLADKRRRENDNG